MAEHGFTVIRTDDLARELMEHDPSLRKKLTDILGTKAYFDGKLDRGYVASQIFQDKLLLEKLEGVVHPAVTHEVERIIQRSPGGPVAVESALILKTTFREIFDYIVLVEAPRDASVERVVREGRLTREAALARLAEQDYSKDSEREADLIIENSGSEEDPVKSLEAFRKKCLKLIALLEPLCYRELPEKPLHAVE